MHNLGIFLVFFAITIIFSHAVYSKTVPQCSMYGVCDSEKKQYCKNDTAPVKINDVSTLKLLNSICPEYINNGTASVCCDQAQITILKDNLGLAKTFIGRCAACLRNFFYLFCALTCDPHQSSFVHINSETNIVTSVNYTISQHFADTFYKSLKNVSSTGGKAIDTICQSVPCTEDKLFEALSDGAPFSIDFVKSNESFAMNKPAYDCNQPVPADGELGGPACSCSDCFASCEFPPIPNNSSTILIFGIDLYWFIFALIYAVFLLSFLTYQIGNFYCKFLQSKDEYEQRLIEDNDLDTPAQSMLIISASIPESSMEYSAAEIEKIKMRISYQTKLSAKLDKILSKCFGYLAFGIASWPITTLVISSFITLILCTGLTKFQVTTDPIELWSDPNSRGRLEKDYFDQNFSPFYRIEQIILQPKNQSNIKMEYYPIPVSFFGPAWNITFLNKTLDLQERIQNIVVTSKKLNKNITLNDICFQPMNPDNKNCSISSPLEYFQANRTLLFSEEETPDGFYSLTYLHRLNTCGLSPLSVLNVPLGGSCLSSSGVPMQNNLVFAGFPGESFNASKAVVLTFLVNNSVAKDSLLVEMALEWETAYLKEIEEWKLENPDIDVFYQAERSVQDELTRQSDADIITVIISYLVMFVYVSLCLGSYRSIRTIFVDMKLSLGLGGVLIVVIAITSSVGIWSYANVPASLIIIEVIPFLVLAVGVDNIFILVQDFELDGDGHSGNVPSKFLPRFQNFLGGRSPNRQLNGSISTINDDGVIQYDEIDDDDGVSTIPIGQDASTFPLAQERALQEIISRVSRTMSRVGPSIFLSSLSEACAFFCGTVSSMPAVRVFSMYAGLAIIINFFMQITVFIALLTLDARRTVARRFDLICCLSLPTEPIVMNVWRERRDQSSYSQFSNPISQHSSNIMEPEPQAVNNTTEGVKSKSKKNNRPWLYKLVANYFAPILLKDQVRIIVVLIMVGWACFCLAIIPNGLEIGLDQKLSMPNDSYMLDYFNALGELLKIGPPVYFVITGNHNYTDNLGQNQVCGSSGCSSSSLVNSLYKESLISNYSRIVSQPYSWIDDYLDWLATKSSFNCCRLLKSNESQYCPPDLSFEKCNQCTVDWIHFNNSTRPSEDDFSRYLPFFLEENPGIWCPKAGRAAYANGVKLIKNDRLLTKENLPLPISRVQTSYFMTYHLTLQKTSDYIESVRQTREIADKINLAWNNKTVYDSSNTKIEDNTVFPYSVFYVFYEQYLDQKKQTVLQLGICFLAIFLITLFVLGFNWLASLIVFLGVAQILISVMGVMVLFGISLNALSLVNLVVCVGIAVEFCVHIVRAYIVSLAKTRKGRAENALATMGSSVLRGITLTKLGGILVLAFSKSRLFQIFYFRMYLSMVISGAIVGLVFVPVILSYIGPNINPSLVIEAYKRKQEDEKIKKANMKNDSISIGELTNQ